MREIDVDEDKVATRTVVKRGGTFQVNLPPKIIRRLQLSDGDTIAFIDTEADIVLRKLIKSVYVGPSGMPVVIQHSKSARERRIQEILESTSAYIPYDHFELSSGMHSDRYVQVRVAVAHKEPCQALAEEIAKEFLEDRIRVVAGFTVGGLTLAEAVADKLKAKLLIGRKLYKPNRRNDVIFKDVEKVGPSESILLVDDVLTTGASLERAIRVLRQSSRGQLEGLAVVVDRSRGERDFGVKTVALLKIPLHKYVPGESTCPLCRDGIRLVKLGKAEVDPKAVLETVPKAKHKIVMDMYNHVYELWKDLTD